MTIAMPVTNIASVESMNGAPRMAPTPTACDALGRVAAQEDRPEDRDDRDERLRHGRGHGREDAADGALREVQLVAEPLDAVREELGGDQDDRERADEQDDVHGYP